MKETNHRMKKQQLSYFKSMFYFKDKVENLISDVFRRYRNGRLA